MGGDGGTCCKRRDIMTKTFQERRKPIKTTNASKSKEELTWLRCWGGLESW